MKINRLEAHDRLQHLTKQEMSIGECCQNLIDQRPFGNHPFYIFAHTRTHEDGVSKRLIWQPRLTKPQAQSNSMLFKAYPGSDEVRIIWMIPAIEMWDQYKDGNVTEHEITAWSIAMFKANKAKLEEKEPDDLSDEEIEKIYRGMAIDHKSKKLGLILPS